MALTDALADCRYIEKRIDYLNVEIKNHKHQIDFNKRILDRGVANRIRVRVQNGSSTQQSSNDDAQILAEARRLQKEIRDLQYQSR